MKIVKKCDICGNNVITDEWGNGKCKICKWEQSRDCVEYPDNINPPNFVSMNRAKEYYKQGKKLLPSYNEFINLVDRGFDFTFNFKGKKYSLTVHDDFTIWEIDTNNLHVYKTIDDLKNNFEIDGVKISENWGKVNKLKYDC